MPDYRAPRDRKQSDVIADGQHIGFNVMLCDSSPATRQLHDAAGDDGSLDGKFKELVARKAKTAGLKPSEWLASQDQRTLEKLAEDAAKSYVGEISGQAMAKSLALDASERERQIAAQVDVEHAAHDTKFAFLGDRAPKFDREKALFLARSNAGQVTAQALHDTALRNRNAGPGTPVALAPVIGAGGSNASAIHDAARRSRRA